LCPPNSNTRFEKSTSVSDCFCDQYFYDSNSSQAAVECEPCPVGTVCPGGSTLEDLPLRKGYFRLDPTSVDVRVCPDAQMNCSSTFGTSECERLRARRDAKAARVTPAPATSPVCTAAFATAQATSQGSSTSLRLLVYCAQREVVWVEIVSSFVSGAKAQTVCRTREGEPRTGGGDRR
jgi:hypothetical protein